MAGPEELHEVKIVRRTRQTGGKLLLPGKTYRVIKSDFLDLIRCGKATDPTGKLKVAQPALHKKDTGEEAPGGVGESTQTVGTRTVPGDDPSKPKEPKPEDKPISGKK